MWKSLRYVIIATLAVLLLAAAASYGLYRAVQSVPHFYAAEMAIAQQVQENDSDRMLQQATSLHGEFHRRGPWQETIQAKTVNAWLAVDLPRNQPDLLPPGVAIPASASNRRVSPWHAAWTAVGSTG